VGGFITGRVLHGIGTSGLMIGGMCILMRYVPKKFRGRYTSIAYSAAGHAPLVSPLLSALMLKYLGQIWTYLIPGCLSFFAACGSFVYLAKLQGKAMIQSTESKIESINSNDIVPCIKKIFSSPISYIAIMGIIADGISFGTCESTLPAILFEWKGGDLDPVIASLIYSVGPLMFTLLAPLAGYFVDRFGHTIVLLCGLVLMIIFYPLFSVMDHTLAGIGACIGLAYGIASIAEVAVFPFIAHIVEQTGIANADVIGFALADTFIQAGYAVGNIVGRRLFDWNGLLAMGVFDSSICGLAVLTSLLIMYSNRGHPKSSLTPAGPGISAVTQA
jgi:MFS family permease